MMFHECIEQKTCQGFCLWIHVSKFCVLAFSFSEMKTVRKSDGGEIRKYAQKHKQIHIHLFKPLVFFKKKFERSVSQQF